MQTLKILLMSLPLILGSIAQATDWERTKWNDSIPDRIEELHGVFKGKSKNSRKTAYAIVYGILENGEPSGRFNIFLLTESRKYGQVFEGEVIGLNRIALLPLGMTQDKSYLKTIVPPAGTIVMDVDRKGRKTLLIAPLDNRIPQEIVLDRVSDDIRLGPVLPQGNFKNRKSAFRATATTNDSSALNGEATKIGIDGVFYTVFELAGLMVMRSETIDNSLNVYSEAEIGGLVVSILDGRKESIIMAKPSADGTRTPVEILKRK